LADTAAQGESAPAETGKLAPAERVELDRLRAEVAELRRRSGQPRRRGRGWRSPVAALLIVIGCVFAPLSVVGVWSANQVSSTDRYVANMAPLIDEPAIQRALTDKITNQISSHLDVKGTASQAATLLSQRGLSRVGSLLSTYSGALANAVRGFIHSQVASIVAGPAVARLWVQLNQAAHAQIVKALSGQGGGSVSVSNGQVVLDLAPFINVIKSNLAARGLTLVNQLPEIHPTLTLFSAKYLVKAQTGYRLVNALKWVLPILTVVLLGAGVYVARNHRRALIGAALGFAASMLVLGAGLAVFRGIYLGSVPDSKLPADAAAALFDTLVRFIRAALRTLLVVGLIVAAGAFFAGSSVTAVRTRQAIASGFAWTRASGERAGLRTGPAGRWTYAHRKGLRVGAVALAALIFVFWGRPTVTVALVLALLLVIVLGLIELIGQPPARPAAAGQPGASLPNGVPRPLGVTRAGPGGATVEESGHRTSRGDQHMNTQPVTAVDDTTRDVFSGLAVGDTDVLGEALELREAAQESSGLDPRTFSLAKIAALVALEAPPASYMWQVPNALASGATPQDILGVLRAIAPQVGGPRVVSAAPEIMVALGLSLPPDQDV
jgi:alkylhydroperoxidase/carboxymuconolactone decarboxylase family protein YurZ